ncbi:acyltransferase family protein [Halohasta salina]|uniref:acyltransferase family protein n=1 Tax=Halohasta salina TaxID=2961621 RepID=UPI0020A37FD1|nr:acyltransferase [Halohasta salina]
MGDRIYSIDALRIVAMVFIVMIHTDPFAGLSRAGNAVTFVIKTTGRFAVPFFFVTSGYFFALKAADGDPAAYVSARVASLGSIYVFGLLLCAPTFLAGRLARATVEGRSLTATTTESLAEFVDPLDLLYYGTSVSEILWFLPALLFSLLLVALFIRLDAASYVLPVAATFHVVGLLGSTYTMVVDVPFEIRDALFFGFFYTSLGYTIRTRRWEPSADHGRLLAGLVVVFAVLQLVEFYVLGYLLAGEAFGASVYAPSYGIATALLTASLFLFLLSRPRLGVDTPLPSWGIYAVGIYVVHPAVFALIRAGRDVVETMGYPISETIIWHLLLTPTLFVVSWLGYLAADRLRVIEIGGTHWPGGPWLRAIRSG